MSTEWSLPAAFDAVAGAVPDRAVLVCGPTRRTYAEVAARTRGLAAFLAGKGLGVHRERAGLDRWECGQSAVALVLHNCVEYVEAMLGCYRARTVPFNVNHHYQPHEVRSVLDMFGTEAVIYHRALGPLVAAALGDQTPLLIEVDDASGAPRLAGAVATPAPDRALPPPNPDDLYVVCTGGTTGSPKGVLWRQGDIFIAGMGG